MEQQQKTKDLAEKVMGWTPTGYTNTMENGWLFQRDGELSVWVCSDWNPFTSRDNAHELLGKLTDEQWLYFGTLIRRQIRESGDYIQMRRSLTRCLLMLTPAQISEAVWRAVC